MKTKDFIRILQKEDPSGELECCVNNVDIHFVSREPSYHDGCLQRLLRNEEKKFYNIIGAEIISEGSKISIHTLDVEAALFQNPDLPISYSEYAEKKYKKQYEELRKKYIDIHNEIERENFVALWKEKGIEEKEAVAFYNANLSYKDSMPRDIIDTRIKITTPYGEYDGIPSWNERRRIQWEREIREENGKLHKR